MAWENKQWDYISKEDASSPTVATESVHLPCIVDAEEGWYFAVVDIPNAFIQTRVKNEKEHGVYQDSRSSGGHPSANRSWCVQAFHFKKQEGGKTVSGTVPERPLWYNGCKPVVLFQIHEKFDEYWLWYQSVWLLRIHQDNWRPEDDQKMTICFHVDDCKLSHRKKKVMDSMIDYLRQ
jgi:hypothetical protein